MKLPPNIQKIIIFRALQLGDMLCAIPALRALRKSFPQAHITLAGLPWAKSFTERFSNYFDEFIWFPGYPGLPEQPVNPGEFLRFLTAVQQQQYDLALQMQGNGYLVNPMVELFDARYTAGFFKPGDYRPNEDYFLQYPDCGSEIERHLRLMGSLGMETDGVELEFPITARDRQDFDQLCLPFKPKKYVCIHPGSRGSWRQWPVQYFAAIADYCIESGFEAVLTGTKDECAIIDDVITGMRHRPVNTCGKTSLGAVAILIKNAAALISNCTGVSHIASALKTPSIVISMDGEPERWRPIDKALHYTIDWTKQPDFQNVFVQTQNLLQNDLMTSI